MGRQQAWERLPRQAVAVLAIAAGLGGSTGCASTPQPIVSDTQLGRVIIYRNGVAYFERYAKPGEETLTLQVPSERVDDFLKSLTVEDEQSGKTMPVSFPTMDQSGSEVLMTIKLPQSHNRLKISYVTESPAWKPTYRVVLADEGPATLQAWAVVDNVSGEDWENVRIGVGSTSALSFRYDLHSVRLVQRETLSSGSLVAVAPPTGGSPYAASGKQVRVMGQMSAEDLAEVQRQNVMEQTKRPDDETLAFRKPDVQKRRPAGSTTPRPASRPAASPGDPLGGLSGTGQGYGGGGYGLKGSGSAGSFGAGRASTGSYATAQPITVPSVSPAERQQEYRTRQAVQSLSNQLRSNEDRVRIEGFAQSGDKDPRAASLERANALRERLIADGIAAARIDAVGTGVFNEREAVRVVAAEEGEQEQDKQKAKVTTEPAPAEAQPLGHAHFVAKQALTIKGDHSAMVSILNTEATAERVYFYDPVSARGSKKYAFNAVRLVNPSPYTLDSGPFTVYAEGQFLGEGLSEPILPKSVAFIPYALDRSIIADDELTTREEIEELLTIQRGIVTTETRRIRKTKLTLTNRGKELADVYVRHAVAPGFKLSEKQGPLKLKVEKLGGAHLFPVSIKAGDAVELIIEEWTPIEKTIDIRTDAGIAAVGLYLKKADLDNELRQKLEGIIEAHKKSADLQERIDVLGQQMDVYRTRVDEINVQLVTLKKVPQAAKLRQHLAAKMEEISERLQQATMEMTDLKGKLMTLHIELQDKLAELTLKQKDAKAADEEKGS